MTDSLMPRAAATGSDGALSDAELNFTREWVAAGLASVPARKARRSPAPSGVRWASDYQAWAAHQHRPSAQLAKFWLRP